MTNSNDDDKNEGIANACAICLENMEEDLATLVCGHVFHDTCATQALVRRPACPVCRRKASRRIRLYLSIGAREEEHVTKLHRNRGGSLRAELCTSHNRTTQTVSHLPERMREMKDELDRVNEIQRLTSSHSFRLENKLVRLRQQQEQTKQQIEHIQHDLDRANAKLKRSQRIATASYAQCKELKERNIEFERNVCSTADRMLAKIRECQRTCCPSCISHWIEMKHIALKFMTTSVANNKTCCQRHGQLVAMNNIGERLVQHHHHAQPNDV